MYRIVNVPRAADKRVRLEASTDGQSAMVRVVELDREPPYNSCGVWDVYIGDHMFEADKRDDLRKMVAEAVANAITNGRDIGYLQAQADIRAALGVKVT